MNKKRIVVTGLGVVSCFGSDVDEFFKSLLAGKSGIAPITSFPVDELPTRFAGEVKDFNPEGYIEKKQARRVDKCIAYGIVAGKKALESAGLTAENLEKLDKARGGVILGSGMGGMSVYVDGTLSLYEKGWKKVTPFFVPYILSNMPGALLGMDLGWMGPNYSISTACATANNSIYAAAQHIYNGEADFMLCGGTEGAITPIGMAGFSACKALSQRNDEPTKASRPWDKERDGFVMGEGSGVLLLETLEHAQARGAKILAEYLGGGISCDAYHMTEPRSDGKGVKICVMQALKNSNVTPEQVDYINAHATSTPAGDMAEIGALHQVFADPRKASINSTKSMIGHCLGAAGGVEAVATIKSIQEDIIHPTINLVNPEENIGFRLPTQAEERKVNIAISNSFGFGGHNATLVFGKFKD